MSLQDVSLQDFPRYPLLFGPEPGPPVLTRLTAAPRRRHASGPSARTATAGWRTAATRPASSSTSSLTLLASGADTLVVDRRLPVQPHPPGRRGRRAARPQGRSRPGALGRLAGRRQRPGRQHHAVADHGRRGAARPVRVRHRLQGQLEPRPSTTSASAAARRTASRRAPPTTGSAASASRSGPTRCEQQERELGVFFDTIVVCSVTGSTHAGMIAGFAGQDRPRRVIGIDASAKLAETRDQVARIARDTAELIGLGRDLRDDEITVLEGWAGELLRHPGAVDARRDPAHGQPRGRDHRPGLRGQVDGRAHRPGHDR